MKRNKSGSRPTSIRFEPSEFQRLNKASTRFQLKISDLIRRAVTAKLDEWEKAGVIALGK